MTLLIPAAHSLKERRMVLRRIKDRVAAKFNCAVADVGLGEYKDSWQSAQLGFAVVSNERAFSQAMMAKVVDFIEELSVAKIVDDERDFVGYGDEGFGESAPRTAADVTGLLGFTEADFARPESGVEAEVEERVPPERPGSPGRPDRRNG